MPNETEGDLDQTPPEPPKYVTAEEIGNIVNSAVTSHLKRSLGSAIETAIKPLADKFAALQAPPPSNDEDGVPPKKGKQTPEMLAMAKQIEDLTKTIVTEREGRAAAEKKQREDRAYAELRSSLEGKVRPELLDMVAKNLFFVEGRVIVEETGNVLFKSQKVPYTGAEAEEVQLPLKSGIDDFLKSDTAKPFLPAPNSGAGGSPLPKRGPSPNPGGTDFSKPATSDADKARRAAERERIALEKLNRR